MNITADLDSVEYLLLPENPTDPIARVPCVGSERYDGGPFLPYLQRYYQKHGIDKPVSTYGKEYMIQESLHPSPSEEYLPLYQTWLFFGLLSEFSGWNAQDGEQTGKEADPVYEELVGEDDSGSYVKTNKILPFLSKSWQFPLGDLSQRSARYVHLAKCLNCVFWMLGAARPAERPNFDRVILYSIAVLGDFLCHPINFALQKVGVSNVPANTGWSNGYYDAAVKKSMVAAGWCPSEIARIVAKFQSLQSLHFLSQLKRPGLASSHEQCTETECRVYQKPLKEHYAKHSINDCTCEHVEVLNQQVVPILEEHNCIPLIKITPGPSGRLEDMKLEIVRSSPNTPYVAISHVWSDGLGNPQANSLPRCQLLRLSQLVQDVLNETMRNSKKDEGMPKDALHLPLIWLDTLCCPVEPLDAKKLALNSITQVYRHATAVLVLDSSLESYYLSRITNAEAYARIFTAPWQRRLWTLQEGALAGKLYFQFANGAISLDHLDELFVEDKKKDIRLISLGQDLVQEFIRLRLFFVPTKIQRAIGNELNFLDRSLDYRSVTVPSDEALCISTLLSLRTDFVLGADEVEERMQRVWRLILKKHGGLPAKIIFFDFDRLTIPGWRWAPRSLLGSEKGFIAPHHRLVLWLDPEVATYTPSGLKVRFPGAWLRLLSASGSGSRDQTEVSSSDTRQTASTLGPWYSKLPKLADDRVLFRDVATQKWYSLASATYGFKCGTWSREELEAWRASNKPSLHEMIRDETCAIILPSTLSDSDRNTPGGGWLSSSQGLFVKAVDKSAEVPKRHQPETKISSELLSSVPSILQQTRSFGLGEESSLPVRTVYTILVSTISPSESLVWSTAERLAAELGSKESVLQLKKIWDERCRGGLIDEPDDELKAAITAVKDEMKTTMRDAYTAAPELKAAMEDTNYSPDSTWVCISELWHRKYECEWIPKSQTWFVD